jgi:NTE family protein
MSQSSASGARKTPDKTKTVEIKQLNLALQGGGSHGAFTWGVLDRLLEEEDIEIAGISGTSAGAMNAAVLIDGYNEGGRGLAKEKLYQFWYEIAAAAAMISPFTQTPPVDTSSYAPGWDWLFTTLNPADMLSRVFSPYELNPLNINPLKDVLSKVLKTENLQNGIHFFVTATNVETGQARIFKAHEITIDVLLASACLPFVYQAVEIEGEPYWDGGYMGNPSIWPLIYKTSCADMMLVQINPLRREGTPRHAIDIINRVNEISFNSSLLAELRAINFVKKLIHTGQLDSKDYTDVRMHRVMPPVGLHEMNAASKMNASWEFFQDLRQVGRNSMEEWLKKHKHDIGKHNTVDIAKDFLVKPKHSTGAPNTKVM